MINYNDLKEDVESYKERIEKYYPFRIWVVFITLWDDDTWQIEYRHKDIEIDKIYRFFREIGREESELTPEIWTTDEMSNFFKDKK
jgi:hypothetical protein